MNQQEFLQRYKYDRRRDRIGSGGFGSVYKVFDTLENEYVALKIAEVNPMHESLSLLKEVELASSLARHVNIGKYTHCYRFDTPTGIYDFGILQYYPEGNLSQLIRNHKLTPEEKEHIALGIVNGLQHLHNHNIIHRDLKSANILIAKGYGGEYVPKIADFGLSKQFAENDKSYFSNSFAGGSLHYVAPEQLEGKELRKNVDLWSLGVVLYELFVGETPFKASLDDGSETARAEIIKNIRNAIIPSTIGIVPSPWKDIIQNCLVPDPSKRIKTIEEVQQKLNNNNRKENFENDKTEVEKIIDKRELDEKIDKGGIEEKIEKKHGEVDKTPNNKNSWSILVWFVVLTSFLIIGNLIWNASNNRVEAETINNSIYTKSGYEYRVITKGEGEEAKPDSYIYFTLEIKDDTGKVLQSMIEDPNMPIMFLPADRPATEAPNPVLDVLSVCRVGDVVVLIMPVDSLPNAPEGIAGMKFIQYEMTIKNVTDKAAYDKYIREMEKNSYSEKVDTIVKPIVIEKPGEFKKENKPIKTVIPDENIKKESIVIYENLVVGFYIFVGSFIKLENAKWQESRINNMGILNTSITKFNNSEYYSVIISPFKSENDAMGVLKKLEGFGFNGSIKEVK